MERAYLEAWRASDASNSLLKQAMWAQYDFGEDVDPFYATVTGVKVVSDPDYPKLLYANAEAEDVQADQQASLLILMADDALQRYSRELLGKSGLYPGYGPDHFGIKMTTLLRAGTNTLRHVSEWDEMFDTLPYPELDTLNKKDPRYQPMQSIEVLQRVFGYAKSDFVRGVVSWVVVARIDGQYGTATPEYQRFEQPLVEAAKEIAATKSMLALKELNDELARALRSVE